MISVGIAGGSGFAGGELIRILLAHPEVELQWVLSQHHAGKSIAEVHDDFHPDLSFRFSSKPSTVPNTVFLALPHQQSKSFLEQNPELISCKLIDLSQDFRYTSVADDWVYGLPELNRDRISRAQNIANPGCFATAITLALLPITQSRHPKLESVFIQGITGVTGAGAGLSETSQYAWRSGNLSNYKVFQHQHLHEIQHSLGLQEGILRFIPMRGPFSRGIFINALLPFSGDIQEVKNLYADFYAPHPFTIVQHADLHLKQVVNTAFCRIQVQADQNNLLISAAIDNLLKGAASTAAHNFNLMQGFPEETGLVLKPIAY